MYSITCLNYMNDRREEEIVNENFKLIKKSEPFPLLLSLSDLRKNLIKIVFKFLFDSTYQILRNVLEQRIFEIIYSKNRFYNSLFTIVTPNFFQPLFHSF